MIETCPSHITAHIRQRVMRKFQTRWKQGRRAGANRSVSFDARPNDLTDLGSSSSANCSRRSPRGFLLNTKESWRMRAAADSNSTGDFTISVDSVLSYGMTIVFHV